MIKTQNGNVYIAYEIAPKSDNPEVTTYNYDTIINSKLTSVSITLSKDGSFQKANDIIEKVEYNTNEESQKQKKAAEYFAILTIILIIVVIILKIFVKRKKDIKLNAVQIVKYEKVRGCLLAFLIMIILRILFDVLLITLFLELTEYATMTLMLLCTNITAIMDLFVIILIFKKKEKTPKRLENLMFASSIVTLIIYFLVASSGYSSIYLIGEIVYQGLMIEEILTIGLNTISMIYFKKSKRCISRYNN